MLFLAFLPDLLQGQDVFSLSIQGPSSITTLPGITTEAYGVFLGHTGSGSGAQAWSFGVSANGAAIASATTAGTAADVVEKGGFRLRGFEKTEIVDRSKNGNTSGAVSGVVLSLTDPVRLPANSSQKVAALDVDFEVTQGLTIANLDLVNGLQGSGLPVKIAVTQEGLTREPFLRNQDVVVRGVFDCCDASLNAGFSAEPIRGAPPFEGILGAGPYCTAEEGVIFHAANAGPVKVFLNIVSNLDDLGGVQGWSFSVFLAGDGDVLSATTAGTAADRQENGGLWSSGFNKTEYSNLRLGGSSSESSGAISGVVLSLTEGTTLPPRGTESVLALEVTGPEAGTSFLFLRDGLRGSGQPVSNVITVGGDSRLACNQGTARVVIQHGHVDDSHLFTRGNANNDLDLDIADPIWIVNELYLQGPPAPCLDDADANDDGLLDASDVVFLIEYLFRAGASPPAPFSECGTDPTSDELSCFGPSLECG